MITNLGKLWPQFNGHGPGFSWHVGSCRSSLHLSTSAVQCLQGTFSLGQIFKWCWIESRRCDPAQPLGHSIRRNEQISWCLSLQPCAPTHVHPTFVHWTVNLDMTEQSGMLIFNVCSLIFARHTAQAFSLPPPDWVEMSCCKHSWHPLCPHNRDTGLFISSLLRGKTRFHQKWLEGKNTRTHLQLSKGIRRSCRKDLSTHNWHQTASSIVCCIRLAIRTHEA